MSDAPTPNGQPPQKIFAFRLGLGLSALGIILLETGLPGIIILVVGVGSLIVSGFFDRFLRKP